MSSNSVLRALLSKGYFLKELPPTFTTALFGDYAREVINAWEGAKLFERQQKKKNQTSFKSKAYGYIVPKAEMENISIPKIGFERRSVGITHPIPQSLLASEISDNYRSVQKWLTRQTYSMDEIRISPTNVRAIKGINFPLHRAKKSFIEATSDWLVKTDITRFYPSIYTHSLTWAAYGKEKVKSKLKTYEGSLADRIDILVRACNRNQTIGIPVGPETSRIIAEVISSRIDDDLKCSFSDITADSIDRLQDDWFIGVNTLERSEKILSQIIAAYREYSLDINGRKTSVTRVIQHSDDAWKAEIGGFLSHKVGALRGARLQEFLGLTLRLQTQYEQQAVANYSLAVLEGQRFRKQDVEHLESFLLKTAIISPASMSRIGEILINLDFDTGAVSKRRVGRRFIELARRSLENGNTYEALWLLYTLRGLKISISDKHLVDLCTTVRSSAIALTILDMNSKGLLNCPLPTEKWSDQISEHSIHTDWTWLLAYEGMRRGWLPDNDGLMTKPFFSEMNSRGIVFYDERRNVKKRQESVKIKRIVRRQSRFEVKNFMLAIREIDFDSDVDGLFY